MRQTTRAELNLKQGFFELSLQIAEDCVNLLKQNQNDVVFYSICTYQNLADVFISLWEGNNYY